jgi:pimeloyl-ACP methyl ester carboxylesterase
MCHPDQVKGMVLIDPAHEDQFHEFPWDFTMGFKFIIPFVFKIYQNFAWTGLLRAMDAVALFNFPPLFLLPQDSMIRKTAIALYSNGLVWHSVAKELEGCEQSFQSMKAIRKPLPDVPIGLVIADHRKYSPTLFPDGVTKAFLKMHAHLPAKLYLADSDHWVHMQQPHIVLEAFDHVLSQMTL